VTTVLLCEDNEDIREMVTFILEAEGFRVLGESRGRSALERARQESVDLMLLDLRIPDMDGYEVLKALRSDLGEKAPPVIVLSAKSAPEDREAALALGAKAFVAKPFSVDGLLLAVRREVPGL